MKQGNKIEQIKNTMYVMKDTIGTTWYIDLAWFWVYRNRERKSNNIIKALLQVVNKIISLKELNSLVVMNTSPNQRGDKGIK